MKETISAENKLAPAAKANPKKMAPAMKKTVFREGFFKKLNVI